VRELTVFIQAAFPDRLRCWLPSSSSSWPCNWSRPAGRPIACPTDVVDSELLINALAESPSELEPTGSHKEKGPGAELCAELGSPTKEPTAQRYVEQSHGVKREKKGR
jgi:hypothetical protein